MKIITPAVFVFDTKGKLEEIKNVVIDFEDADYDLFTTIKELRLPSKIDGKESNEFEDIYTDVTLLGAIGSRVECSIKTALQQRKQ